MQNLEVLLAIATASSAAVSLFVNFVYQEYIRPGREKRRARRDTLARVGLPMLRSVKTARSYVDLFLRERRRGWWSADPDGMFRMSVLYALAEVYGWARRIEEDAFIDIAPPQERAGAFHVAQSDIFKALTSATYWRDADETAREAAIAATVPRRVLQAVGELMIVRERDFAEDHLRLLPFHVFVYRYENEPIFRRWMDAMGAPFTAAEGGDDDAALARIALLANGLKAFAAFLERYLNVQSERREVTSKVVLAHLDLLPEPVIDRFLFEHRRSSPPVKRPEPGRERRSRKR